MHAGRSCRGRTRERESLTDLSRDVQTTVETDGPWCAVVWNDPVNLMSYVVFVFRRYFGLLASGGRAADDAGPRGRPRDRLPRFPGTCGDRRPGHALLRTAGDAGESGGELMAHAFRRRPDGSLACRLDGEEKAIIAQVAQETRGSDPR